MPSPIDFSRAIQFHTKVEKVRSFEKLGVSKGVSIRKYSLFSISDKPWFTVGEIQKEFLGVRLYV